MCVPLFLGTCRTLALFSSDPHHRELGPAICEHRGLKVEPSKQTIVNAERHCQLRPIAVDPGNARCQTFRPDHEPWIALKTIEWPRGHKLLRYLCLVLWCERSIQPPSLLPCIPNRKMAPLGQDVGLKCLYPQLPYSLSTADRYNLPTEFKMRLSLKKA